MTKYILMVLTGAVSYGILSSFVKLAYGYGYHSAEIAFLQALLGALLLLGVWGASGKPNASRSQIPLLLVAGAAIGAATFLYYLSVKYIPASVAIVLLMQFTWFSLLLEWIFFRKRPLLSEGIVTVVILGGSVLASGLLSQGPFLLSVRGVVIVLCASVVYALYIVINSRADKATSWQAKSAWMMIGSAVAIFLMNFHSLVFENHFGLGLLKWGVFLAFFGTVLPPILFAIGMPKIGASTSGLVLTAELPVAVLTAHFLLKEPISFSQLMGIALMLGSLIALNRVTRQKQ